MPLAPNPFRYGSPVTGENFTGRRLELQALVERATHGINVSVVSPRRYGKTSLLLAAEAAAGRLGAVAVHVNVLLNPGPARFASALATSYARSRRQLLRRGAAVIAELRGRFRLAPTFEVGDEGRPKLSFAPSLAEPDAMGVLEDVYRLLSEDERQPMLVLDEFDSIVEIEARSAEVLKGLAGPVPNDIQHLAFEAFTVGGDVISGDDVEAGMDRAVALNEATYTEAWQQRSAGQRRVLAALAHGAAAEPFGREFARRTGLAPSSVQRAIEALADDDWVVATEAKWHLTDPFFTRWVRSLDWQ